MSKPQLVKAKARLTPSRGVPVELDRTRYLRYTLATMRNLRADFGKELDTGITDDKLAKVLLAGLRGEDPNLTLVQLEEMIDLENLSSVLESMRKAMGQNARIEMVAGPPEPLPAVEEVAAPVADEDGKQPGS